MLVCETFVTLVILEALVTLVIIVTLVTLVILEILEKTSITDPPFGIFGKVTKVHEMMKHNFTKFQKEVTWYLAAGWPKMANERVNGEDRPPP